jgi:hypothetical protein
MTRKSKCRNTCGINDKGLLPRCGEKSKQTKVTPAKETLLKIVRQTKLTFATTSTDNNTHLSMPKHLVAATFTILPENCNDVHQRLPHPSLPTTPDQNEPKFQEKGTDNNKQTLNKPKGLKTNNDNNKKPSDTRLTKKPTSIKNTNSNKNSNSDDDKDSVKKPVMTQKNKTTLSQTATASKATLKRPPASKPKQ